ncbi:hypothetical protein A1O7_04145 [Cladophialophora yegresii CBS 114405]|uniref:SET domain-containing protein n=1 Tax=Cladophialophora yegresii CBS 114405 TaxID=1182544 RepID=W9VVY6_9EURO|nr:uncharacterized protein A1O7_04145 [Cladophialophora yegresii CBS 114405]EXJ59997.1 hypothetical protein A1O7_04145 [Cladophialophora yegresii CBS 114405]
MRKGKRSKKRNGVDTMTETEQQHPRGSVGPVMQDGRDVAKVQVEVETEKLTLNDDPVDPAFLVPLLEDATSSTDASSTTPPPQDTLLKVVSTPDRGLAVFTTRKIKAGTLILAERPLVALSKTEEIDPQSIERHFAALYRPDQKAYLSLFDAQKSRMSRVVSIYYSNCYNCECQGDGRGEGSSTRGGDGSGSGSAIGALSSRINHSCVPNVQFSYHVAKGEMRFFAVRDIPRGREVCGNYERDVCHRVAERQRRQRLHYGFGCACEACVPRTEFWARSDERRRGMYDALGRVKGLEKRWGQKQGQGQEQGEGQSENENEKALIVMEALDTLARLEGLLIKEGLVGVPLANAYRRMAKWAGRDAKTAATTQEVVKWKTRELQVCVNCFGGDGQRTQDIRAALDDLSPQEERYVMSHACRVSSHVSL